MTTHTRAHTMTRTRTLAGVTVVLGCLTLSACTDLQVPDYNNPSLQDLQDNPTPTKIAAAAQGLLVGTRAGMSELNGGSPAFGGNLWGAPYRNIRNANILLTAVPQVTALSDAEKAGVAGFAKTVQALDLLNVINTRDAYGAPTDVDIAPNADPAPIATKAEVFAQIVSLLDDAKTDLQAAGTAFAFGLSDGFAGFDTPAAFLQFNRALRARVAVYNGDFSGALTALGESFVSTSASLDLGVHHVYSTRSGDVTNGLFDPTAADLLAHPSIQADAQLRADATRDLRFQNKVVPLPDPHTVRGITTQLAFNVYTSNTSPVPIIRNEELILLRAEANIGLNTVGSNTAALGDINLIRTTSG